MNVTLTYPRENDLICLHTEAQERFIADDDKRAAFAENMTFHWYALEEQGTDYSLPLVLRFTYTFSYGEEEQENKGYPFLVLSETPDMKRPAVFAGDEQGCDVTGLKIGTRYYWRVQKGGVSSGISSFTTQNVPPRYVRVDGISNVRDAGGYAVPGGKIRQGLLYRGGEGELHMHLTPRGMDDVRTLGIKTEFDMRGEAVGQVDFTTMELCGVKRILVPEKPYAEVFSPACRKAVKAFFKALTKKSNLPMYYHCWGGADRTGSFAYLLGAFLGMSREDLLYDYELTSLSKWGVRSRNYGQFKEMERQLSLYPGETLKEKAAAFLLTDIGLTEKELNAIETTFVEKTK
ncbi:MAG: tyrosine-protein phosphatase [Clostridia bacterium]|nr:tyrosine-protein phosphatase [Clostridia bacterium]